MVNVAAPEKVAEEAADINLKEASAVAEDVQVKEPEVVIPAVAALPEEEKEPVEVKAV